MKLSVTPVPKSNQIFNIGDIGVVRHQGEYFNHYLLRCYDGFIDLNQPRSTWVGSFISKTLPFDLKLEHLPKGTIITLEVE